jgi:hypothetical protein
MHTGVASKPAAAAATSLRSTASAALRTRGFSARSFRMSADNPAAAAATAAGGRATSFNPAARLAKFTAPTVWHEFTPLAQKSQAVNLGQ